MNTVTQTMQFRQSLLKYAEKYGVTKAAIKYNVNRQYIYRWKRRYNGDSQSLANKSHRPHHHPNQHTEAELQKIKNFHRRNPNTGLVVLWVKLRRSGYTVDHHAVAAPAMEDETYCATTGNFMTVAKEKSPTLAARDYKDPPIVNGTDEPYYIVRRLTPVECARLQGFPDWWCSDLGTEAPTEDDIRFWSEVWETHRKVMDTSQKPKSEKQVIKWLKDPYSDSAEYKLWGNGVSLPIVFFVLSGIVWAASKE